MLKNLFRAAGFIEAMPQIPSGMRIYAIGDIHGRFDLLKEIISLIGDDGAAEPSLRSIFIFLGDLVDRGPDSAAVVEYLRSLSEGSKNMFFLLGNHEEVLLRVYDAEPGWFSRWLEFGGDACAASYNLAPINLAHVSDEKGAEMLAQKIPPSHIAFIRSFQDSIRIGDYLFVHAGIRPGVPIERQSGTDLRWIREPFLSDRQPHGATVIHGHTIVDEPEDRGNRVGIDTGAYYSGKLTALVLEGATRRYLATGLPLDVRK